MRFPAFGFRFGFNGAADFYRRKAEVNYSRDFWFPELQWGRRFLSAERKMNLNKVCDFTESFNGAADFYRRKGESAMPCKIPSAARFNGAADFYRRKACSGTRLSNMRCWLQWGRRFLSAERKYNVALITLELSASMGPPIFIGGKETNLHYPPLRQECFNGAADFYRRKGAHSFRSMFSVLFSVVFEGLFFTLLFFYFSCVFGHKLLNYLTRAVSGFSSIISVLAVRYLIQLSKNVFVLYYNCPSFIKFIWFSQSYGIVIFVSFRSSECKDQNLIFLVMNDFSQFSDQLYFFFFRQFALEYGILQVVPIAVHFFEGFAQSFVIGDIVAYKIYFSHDFTLS